jgi:hypothetical protein
MDELASLHFLVRLSPVARIAKKVGFIGGQNKCAIAAGETTEITDIFETCEKDAVQMIRPHDLPNRILSHFIS